MRPLAAHTRAGLRESVAGNALTGVITSTSRAMTVAMLCAAAVTAQYVSGKAIRDALFFTSADVTALPAMLTAAAASSIFLVWIHARIGRTVAPRVLVPATFVVSGVFFVVEWIIRSHAPSAVAVLVYLHVSGITPLLASGVWLLTSERFNPRTAKKGFGRVAAAGTLGGLVGTLVSERVAAVFGGPSMLLMLAGSQLATAWLVRVLANSARAQGGGDDQATAEVPVAVDGPARSGLRVIAESPYLRDVVAVVVLGTAGAALLDYLFKAHAVQTFGTGDGLLRFFAWYYAGCSLVAFLLQTALSRAVLERFGLGLTTSTPSVALVVGGIGGLVAPGFGSLLLARAGESIFRGSLFRASYEVFYTPIPAAERRAAKSLIDVGFDRLGDAVGAALVRLVLICAPAAQSSAMLSVAIATSIGAIAVATRLNRWYIRTLETNLLHRGGGVDLSSTTIDGSTAKVLESLRGRLTLRNGETTKHATVMSVARDPVLQDILALQSGSRHAVTRVLSRSEGPSAVLVPHVIALLNSDMFAEYALFALRKVAEERVGQLTDALVDPAQDDATRRRLARVFSVCVSQRAADALVHVLDDQRFDVRYHVARSLAAIYDRNPRVKVDRDRIIEVVLREISISVPVWESERLLDGFVSQSRLDNMVRHRAEQSLGHVFTLLSLVLPREPLQIAFRGVTSDDRNLRGTALEYLEGVLPASVRQALWPYLIRTRLRQTVRPSASAIASLLRSSASVTLKGMAGARESETVKAAVTH